MKMRKKLAAVLAAAMIASVMPMTAFAASTNRVTKTVSVKEDSTIKGVSAPELVIDLKDDLAKDEAFYLELENAEWADQAAFDAVTVTPAGISFKRVDKKILEVKATAKITADGADIKIPLLAKATGGEAIVKIDSYGTVVTGNSTGYVFAVSDDSKAEVKVEDAKTFVDSGEAAKIILEESYPGAFNDKDKMQTVIVELDDKDFSFTTLGKLVGKRGFAKKEYTGMQVKNTQGKVIEQMVKFEIPADALKDLQRGIFEIEGLTIKGDRKAVEGNVTAYVSAPFVEDATVTLAKYGDYSTDLTTKEVKEFTAGTKETVKFKLEQTGEAIVLDRRTEFTFSEDVEIVSVKKAGEALAADIKLNSDDKNEFEISKFPSIKDNEIEFEVEINIPAKFKGDLSVTVEGRSIGEAKEVKLAEVKAPVTVEVEAMSIKAGTRENTGGTITIKETDKKMINRGKLIIQLPKDLKDDGVEFENVEDLVLNTTGGIKVNEAKYNTTTSAIEIEVTRESTEAGSIEISGFEVKAKRAIIDGAYEVEIGGKAISEIADLNLNKDKDGYEKLDAITSADFILVGNVYANAEVVFNIGSEKFTVNGKEMTMDAQAYIQDGRTMVPLRYLSYALGIDEESIKFNSGIVTIFAADGRVIQVKNGDKNLAINGMTIPMAAAAEIKEGRTYVPVTEIGGVFGVTGTWDAASQTATFK